MAIFSAIGAAISGFFASLTWASVGTLLLETAVSLGLSVIAQVLSGKKDLGQDFGVKGQLERGADVPQAFILGRYATAGSLTYGNTSQFGATAPNGWMNWVITLSDLPCGAITGVWVNGVKEELEESLDGWLSAVSFIKAGPEKLDKDRLQFKFYDGTQTEADPWLTAHVSSEERPWDSEAVGHGKAYVVVRAHIDSTLYRNGFPNFLFEVDGIPLYNPAKDSSVGGAGAHRWSNPATWEISENPAVQLYNVLRGLRYNGQWFYGLQDVAAAQLPVAHWIAQIAKCAAPIEAADGSEPAFRSSAEIPISAKIHEVIESLLTACNGRLSDAGGVYKLFAGAPDEPVMTLTDADIISTSEQSFTPFLGLADTVNGVAARYPSPAAGWQVETAPPVYRPDYEAQDGGRRLLVDVSLDFVPYAEQAQRLMQAALNEARRARRHTFHLPPKFWPLEPGDVISWTSARNGYLAKHFRVDGVIDLPDADVIVDLTEVDPSDYDFDTETDFTPPAVPGVLPQPIPVQLVQGFLVEPATLHDENGTGRRPAIRAVWDGDREDVRSVIFQLRVAATGEEIDPARSDTVADGELYISNGILPAVTYDVRAKFVPNSPRPTEWTDWQDVTTFDIRLAIEDLNDEVQTAFERHDVALEDADGTLGELRDAVTTALGSLDAPISLTDRVIEAYGPLDQEIPLNERIQTLTGNYELALPERIDASRQLDLLNERLLSETLERAETERVLSQAGIVVDEATGRVTIEGLVQTQQRITEVRVVTDALLGQINLTVTRAQLLEEISRAVLSPEQVPIFDGLQGQITTLQTLLDVATATIALKADIATVDAYGISLSEALVQLNALDAELLLRVSTSDFTAVADRLTSVETAFSALEGAELTTIVSDVHRLFHDVEAIHETTLEGLLDALEGREASRVDLALVREDLTARVFEGEQSVAALRQSLITTFADATALIRRESETRAAALLAQAAITDSLRTDLDATDGQVTGTAQAVDALAGRVQETEEGLEVSVQSTEALTARIASETGDRTNAIDAAFEELIETDLRALLDDHDTRQLLLAGIAQAKQDVFAIVLEGREALAGARAEFTGAIGNTDARVTETVAALATEERARIEQATILLGRLAAAEGALSQLNTVDVTSSSALVQAFLALTGRVGDTEGAIEQINTVDVESDSALVQALLTLIGRVGDTEGAIEQINTVDVESDSSLVQAYLGLSAEVTDPTTGLSATRGSVETLQEVVGDTDSGAILRDVNLLNGQIFTGGPNTIVADLTDVRQIVLDEETGLVSKVTQLSATLENVEGGLVGGDAFDALFAEVTQNGDELTALTARQNVISANLSSGNLLPDPNLIIAGTWTFAARWSRVPITVLINNPDGSTTTQVIGGELQYTGGVSQVLAQSPTFPVTANAIHTMGFEARSTSAGSTAFLFRLEFLNASGAVLAALPSASGTMADGTHRYEGSFKAPATAASARMRITASGTGSARLTALATRQDLVRGEIEQLAATRVTAEGAVSAVEQVISASYGDLEGLAEDTAFARAGIDGIAAGYVWRLNGQSLLELVSVSQGTDQEVASTFRIAAQYVQITGIAQIDTAVIELLAVSEALVDNLRVGRAQIEDTIQSDDYAENAQGVPTAGVKLDFRAGYPSIKVAGPVISRQIKVAEGSRAIPQIAFGAQNSGFGLDADDWADRRKTYWVDQTPIPMTAWQQPGKTYLATAALRATVAGSGAPDIYWGVDATILPMTRWDGNQSLRLKLDVWTRNVTGWSAGFIDWTIYEVT